MNTRQDILIVGAGLAGLTLAARLATGEYVDALNIRVVDAGKRPQFSAAGAVSLRVSAIASGTTVVLQQLGAWNQIIGHRAAPYERMRVWDERDTPESEGALRFDAADYALPALGHIVENSLIQHALLCVLDDAGVALQFESPLTELPRADLLVGADGARSTVRQLSGIATNVHPFDQTAVVTHLIAQKEHQRTALQRFMRTGPLGLLPLADGRISVVWSTSAEMAERMRCADDDELSEQITIASDYVLGALTVDAPRATFPLIAHHVEEYVRDGIALIGDAAHAVHPLAGQGANLGIQDAVALAEAIEKGLGNGLAIGDRPVLRRYERERKGPNLAMSHITTGLNRLFATDSGAITELRSIGMRLFGRSGPIRERAVKVALGVD